MGMTTIDAESAEIAEGLDQMSKSHASSACSAFDVV